MERREFIKNSALGLAGLSLVRLSENHPTIPLKLLHHTRNGAGGNWGIPWPKSQLKKVSEFTLISGNKQVPVQSWPLAFWPDGSIKWTGHAIASDLDLGAEAQLIQKKSPLEQTIKISERGESFIVNNEILQIEIPTKGPYLISQIKRNQKTLVQKGSLELRIQDAPSAEEGNTIKTQFYTSEVEKVSIESKGPIRTVIKWEGTHLGKERRLPFVVRMYIYSDNDQVRLLHTIIYDADENKEFISGLGIKFEVDFQKEEWHNRHIRFAGEGIFSEAVRGLTGLRRDPGKSIREAQMEGKRTSSDFNPAVGNRLQYIAGFGDYTLSQLNADGFEIKKRTKAGHSWIQSAHGKRSLGTAYLGSPSGGIVLGLRHFWQSYPAQIDIRKATEDVGEMTMWFWAPDAPPMDLRFYHDGMGQDNYPKQLEGLEINYEDYEPGFGTPYGVARTSEVFFQVVDATPSAEELLRFAQAVQDPPIISATPEYMKQAGAFAGAFPVLGKNRKTKELEDQLDFYFQFYKDQVEEHHWYGYWNYGDFMHSYDEDRHVWKYDIGGFAWDNSELSTDIWLWTYFLSTCRSDVYRLAEAMTRHTGEVDVHHIGRFSPLGSRHNVMHWGCSAKQLRISTAANRRYFYYLSGGDERTGDLMREQIEAARTLQSIVPIRKVNPDVPKNTENSVYASLGFGTDWGAIASAWFTEWERTGDPKMKSRLLKSMDSIAAQPKGFFTGLQMMNLDTGEFQIDQSNKVSVSHLSAVFGLPELCYELLQCINHPPFERAWLQYCILYNASAAEQEKALGESLKRLNLQQGHARLTAYAARNNPALIQRAWEEFYKGEGGFRKTSKEKISIHPPEVLQTRHENPGISTNAVAQWGLAAMQILAFENENR